MHMPKTVRRLLARSAAIVVAACVIGCGSGTASPPAASGSGGAGPTAAGPSPAATGSATVIATPPVDAGAAVATPVDAPTAIDVATTVALDTTIAPDGGAVLAAGATVFVPEGGLSSPTHLVVTKLEAPFNQNPYARDEPGSVKAVPVGPALDFGPAGVAFSKPVTVTLPYDPALVPDGFGTIAVAYWTGSRWSVLGGVVDETSHTVSISQTAFEGEIFTTIAVATAVGLAVNAGIRWYYGKEGVNADPISDKKAAGWIQPKDPTVAAAAKATTVGGVAITDKTKLAAYLAGHADPVMISVTGADGTARSQAYSAGAGSNWQQPADYLGKNGMKGDCTDVTNAMVSVFRAAGYQAKAVFGYAGDKDSPHAWGEVSIGGAAYLIDEEGHLQPLDAAMKAANLIRPDAGDPRNFMWDENGQVPYDAEWWSLVRINGSWAGTFTLTDVTMDEQTAKDAEGQGCSFAILDALKGKPLPMSMDVKVDKAGKGTAKVVIDTSSIKDANGKSLGKADPQTFNVTFDGTTLKFQVEDSGGSTTSMSGTLSEQGSTSTFTGSMTVSGKGFSAKAAWTVTRG